MSLDQLLKSMHSGNSCCTLLEGAKVLILKWTEIELVLRRVKDGALFLVGSYRWAFETMQLSLFLVSPRMRGIQLAVHESHDLTYALWYTGFLGGLAVKNLSANAGDAGLILGWGRSPRGGNGNPLQYPCLEKVYGQRSLVGYSLWSSRESDMTY